MNEKMKSAALSDNAPDKFTDEERAAMKERAQELKADANRQNAVCVLFLIRL